MSRVAPGAFIAIAACLATSAGLVGSACAGSTASLGADGGGDNGADGLADAAASVEASVCATSDVTQIGVCQVLLGFTWTGSRCEPVSGCACGPPWCDASNCACPANATNEECVAGHAQCGSCAPNDASALPDCSDANHPVKWAWTGTRCTPIPPACCSGPDCSIGVTAGGLWDFQADCESYYRACQLFGNDAGTTGD